MIRTWRRVAVATARRTRCMEAARMRRQGVADRLRRTRWQETASDGKDKESSDGG